MRKYNKWTEEEVDFLIKNYNDFTAKKIAIFLNRDEISVEQKIHQLRNKNKKLNKIKKWSDREIKFIKDNFLNMTYDEISKILNRTTKSIGTKIERLGLVKQDQPRYCFINHNFFDKLNDCNTYIIGFIMTDGCISNNRLEIHLKKTDKYILETIRDYLCPGMPVHDHKQEKNGKKFESCRLLINSKKLCDSLFKYGIVSNKTGKEKFVGIPNAYLGHYFRGVFDGDGWVSLKTCHKTTYRYLSISVCCSNKQFLEDLKNASGNYGRIYLKSKTNKPFYVWVIGKQEHVRKIYNLMYFECGNFFLTRKKRIFDDHYEKSNNI